MGDPADPVDARDASDAADPVDARNPADAGVRAAAVVARDLALNGLVGVAFGWCYWRRGVLAAMAAHVAAAVVLPLEAPVVLGSVG